MKKNVLFFFAVILSSYTTYSNPGDSSWVQAHDRQLPKNGNYDTSVVFPAGTATYRKIYMIFTLGKYHCPGNPQYCGDWDYMAQTYVMTPSGDTLELGRLITPYANASYPRTPWEWKERYVFDVTDYYPVLRDQATIRLRYSGSTGGFTVNIKFLFIEGTPERNVIGVTALWRGDFAYGSAATPIESRAIPLHETAPPNTQSAALKFIITGHRSDNNGCAEFCKKYYQVLLNGNVLSQTDIWRDDCGLNRMYPQSGTWIYNRGNWCPGDLVRTNTHVLTGITSGSSYDIDVDFQPYVSTATAPPYYAIGSAIVYYGALNHTLDAGLENIIAPTNNEAYFRENPLAGKPVIEVRNSGSTTITSIKFEYGLPGQLTQYTWNGSLASLTNNKITLPKPPGFEAVSGSDNIFIVNILEVNNQQDEDHFNNHLSSVFTAAPKWPGQIVVELKTNKSSSGGVSETYWKIYDPDSNIVAERINNMPNTLYTDTVILPGSDYKLVITDNGCDGINWWANPSAGTGTLQVRSAENGAALDLNGYFNGDFGCGFIQYFTVEGASGISEKIFAHQKINITAYPNPARDVLMLTLAGVKNVTGKIIIRDMLGRMIAEQYCNRPDMTIHTEKWTNGLYKVFYYDNTSPYNNAQTSFLIIK